MYGEDGYYTSKRLDENIHFRDYKTSPLTHPVFGFLISIFLSYLINNLNNSKTVQITEFGAGNGTLGFDIIEHLDNFTNTKFKYNAIDRVESDNSLIKTTLANKLEDNVEGIIISNELFDAIPNHLFKISENKVLEKYVELKGDNFIEILDEPSDKCIENKLLKINNLPNNFTGEIRCKDNEIFKQINSHIEKGFILTIDYGMSEKQYFNISNKNGLLSVINNHSSDNNYLRNLGNSDISFQVDLEDLDSDLNKINFNKIFLMSQREFLIELGILDILKNISRKNLEYDKIIKNKYSINQLISPNGLGNYFVSLHSNFNCDVDLGKIKIKDNTTIPLLNKFPERFDLPGIYQKEIIFKDNLGKNE